MHSLHHARALRNAQPGHLHVGNTSDINMCVLHMRENDAVFLSWTATVCASIHKTSVLVGFNLALADLVLHAVLVNSSLVCCSIDSNRVIVFRLCSLR